MKKIICVALSCLLLLQCMAFGVTAVDPTVTSIEVVSLDRTTYIQNQEASLADCVLKINYSDGSSKIITKNDYNTPFVAWEGYIEKGIYDDCYIFCQLKDNEDVIEYSYSEKGVRVTTKVPVTVTNREITHAEILNPNTFCLYPGYLVDVGENLKMLVTYNDGVQEKVEVLSFVTGSGIGYELDNSRTCFYAWRSGSFITTVGTFGGNFVLNRNLNGRGFYSLEMNSISQNDLVINNPDSMSAFVQAVESMFNFVNNDIYFDGTVTAENIDYLIYSATEWNYDDFGKGKETITKMVNSMFRVTNTYNLTLSEYYDKTKDEYIYNHPSFSELPINYNTRPLYRFVRNSDGTFSAEMKKGADTIEMKISQDYQILSVLKKQDPAQQIGPNEVVHTDLPNETLPEELQNQYDGTVTVTPIGTQVWQLSYNPAENATGYAIYRVTASGAQILICVVNDTVVNLSGNEYVQGDTFIAKPILKTD